MDNFNLEFDLALRYWDDPVLSTVCEPIRATDFGNKLLEFSGKMMSSMRTFNGVGLAAPQLGIPIRLFVYQPTAGCEAVAMCNPTLELKGGVVFDLEGCLSLPGVFSQVARAPRVMVRYFTPDGVEREKELEDRDARVLQHEADHLDGIMFIDRLASRHMKKAALREWEKQKPKFFSQNNNV